MCTNKLHLTKSSENFLIHHKKPRDCVRNLKNISRSTLEIEIKINEITDPLSTGFRSTTSAEPENTW